MKFKIVVLVLLLAASAGLAQRRPERPKVHADFYFGSYPPSRDVSNLVAKDNVRLLLVGLHNGWELEKIVKETKLPEDELSKLFAELEEQRLAFEVDRFESRPLLPVIRERDMDKVTAGLRLHTQELANILQTNWKEIETTLASLSGAKGVPKEQLLYQVVVGGILFGGMTDAFFEDQTLMPPPPRRVGSQRFYAWLVEGNPQLAGILKREQWDSDGHSVVSIGAGFQKDRLSLAQIRADNGMVLDEAEARRFRSFVAIFSRDRLLPFFKKNRSEFFDAVSQFEAGNYARKADVFSWYYDQIANGVADELVKSGRIKPPVGHYTYAIRAAAR